MSSGPTGIELFKAAIEISARADQIPLRYFRLGFDVELKADESPVTVADRETEEQLRRGILDQFPTHSIVGEEFGHVEGQDPLTWVIDPIDGTKSFISGLPLFGMLLGVLREGVPEVGIMRMPALGEYLAGLAGTAATRNGQPIRVRSNVRVEDATIYLNEANVLMEREPSRLARLQRTGRLRRFSNDCYSYALLAMGHVDAVVECGLKPYDYLPIVPIVTAAGGLMTDWSGSALGLQSDGTVLAASNAAIHTALRKVLAG